MPGDAGPCYGPPAAFDRWHAFRSHFEFRPVKRAGRRSTVAVVFVRMEEVKWPEDERGARRIRLRFAPRTFRCGSPRPSKAAPTALPSPPAIGTAPGRGRLRPLTASA